MCVCCVDFAIEYFAMIDSKNNGNSNRGLATALRDRSRCTIPNQPNRSLPIRPAPNNPCRGILPRKTLQNQSIKLNTTSIDTLSESTSTSSESQRKDDPLSGHIRIEVPGWQKDIRQPYISVINICNTLNKETSNTLKRPAPDRRENSSSSNCNLIDISQSPDRADSSKLDSTDTPRNVNLEQENQLSAKKKRKKKMKKDDVKSLEIDLVTPSKIVPPLRLKKIQSLQDEVSTCGSNWGNITKSEETEEEFRDFGFYQPSPQANQINNDASKYRIVTGTTPPCDAHIDSSTDQLVSRDTADQTSAKKLDTRENKVKFKLSELQNKIAELGREMLRIATSSPDNSVRETIDSYGEEIDKLTKLLKKSTNTPPKSEPDSQFEDVVPVSIVSSTVSPTTCSSSQPIISPTSSPEPPKLSPQNTSTTLQTRNTPPCLAKATLNYDKDAEDPLNEFDGLRGFVTITKKPKPRKPLKNSPPLVASSIITTTTENLEGDVESKPEIFELTDNNVSTQVNGGHDLSIENAKIIDVKSLADCPELHENIKSDGRSPSPGDMVIVTTSEFEEFENGSKTGVDTTITEVIAMEKNLKVAAQLPQQTNSMTTPSISSSGDLIRPLTSPSRSNNNTNNECLDVSVAKDFSLGNEFPTLANWLATTTNKLSSDKSLPTELTVIEANKTPTPFQAQIQFCIPGGIKMTPIDLTTTTITITTATTTNTSTTSTTPTNGVPLANSGREWRVERCQATNPQYQQSLQPQPDYMNGRVAMNMNNVQLNSQQQPQSMRSDYCAPPGHLDRYYPRNYPIDPYSMPYGFGHPPMATSMWGGAVVQHPLLRPRGLPQVYPPRYLNTPMQYNMPPNSLPQPRIPPPLYPISTPAQTGQDSKSASVDNQRMSNNAQTGFIRQKITNSSDSQRIHQQDSQQAPARDQYGRVYTEQINRPPPMPEMSRDQINNYRQPWRGGIVPPGPLSMRNYPVNANWTSDPYSLLAAVSHVALQQNFAPPMTASQRQRSGKELTGDQMRHCETPNLRKVTYSPNTARTLECSNCSMPGPSFKCLGCEAAFYCNENCQVRHWMKHVASCPKRMPKLKKVVP